MNHKSCISKSVKTFFYSSLVVLFMVVGFWSFNHRNGLTTKAAVAEKNNVAYQSDGLFKKSVVEIEKDHLSIFNILRVVPPQCTFSGVLNSELIKSVVPVPRGKRLYSLNAINAP